MYVGSSTYFPGDPVFNRRRTPAEPLPPPPSPEEAAAGLKREAKTATELAIQLRELDAGNAAIQEALADESDPAGSPINYGR